MKSLSPSRPLVILVIGLPGSGKSFFSRQFAEMFGAPLVSMDFIRHTIAPDSQFDHVEDAAVGTIAQNEVTELLKTGKTFIIDGGVNSKSGRQSVAREAKRNGYGILTIWVQTDEPTSQSRSSRRSDKREADQLNASMDGDQFERYRKQFSIPTPSENIIVISGKHTFTTQARIVLKALVAPREGAPVNQQQSTPQAQPHDIQAQRRNISIS
ncbi:MAG TPA: ATP-binding protein [Candidatus Saccharibacteria bacterium]|nr:ATP-binding protein [Candidatus Saccharibacteria bacterium]